MTSNGHRSKRATMINVVRYADDLIITGRSHRQLVRVGKLVDDWLATRGLRLSRRKTAIRRVSDGFDFLGWTIRKVKDGTLLCTVSQRSERTHARALKHIIRRAGQSAPMVTQLNQRIRGWQNYHRCCNGLWKTWNRMEAYTTQRLLKWGRRRHGRRTHAWVYQKYWQPAPDGRRKLFTVVDRGRTYRLEPHRMRQLRVGSRVSGRVNAYDLQYRQLLMGCSKGESGTRLTVGEGTTINATTGGGGHLPRMQRGVAPGKRPSTGRTPSHTSTRRW